MPNNRPTVSSRPTSCGKRSQLVVETRKSISRKMEQKNGLLTEGVDLQLGHFSDNNLRLSNSNLQEVEMVATINSCGCTVVMALLMVMAQ
jgi:hypothetical protein